VPAPTGELATRGDQHRNFSRKRSHKRFMAPGPHHHRSTAIQANALYARAYAPLKYAAHERILFMGRRMPELSKYAANAFLPRGYSFMNELPAEPATGRGYRRPQRPLALIAALVNHSSMLGAYGGSCFPKDIKSAYSTWAKQHRRNTGNAQRGRSAQLISKNTGY